MAESRVRDLAVMLKTFHDISSEAEDRQYALTLRQLNESIRLGKMSANIEERTFNMNQAAASLKMLQEVNTLRIQNDVKGIYEIYQPYIVYHEGEQKGGTGEKRPEYGNVNIAETVELLKQHTKWTGKKIEGGLGYDETTAKYIASSLAMYTLDPANNWRALAKIGEFAGDELRSLYEESTTNDWDAIAKSKTYIGPLVKAGILKTDTESIGTLMEQILYLERDLDNNDVILNEMAEFAAGEYDIEVLNRTIDMPTMNIPGTDDLPDDDPLTKEKAISTLSTMYSRMQDSPDDITDDEMEMTESLEQILWGTAGKGAEGEVLGRLSFLDYGVIDYPHVDIGIGTETEGEPRNSRQSRAMINKINKQISDARIAQQNASLNILERSELHKSGTRTYTAEEITLDAMTYQEESLILNKLSREKDIMTQKFNDFKAFETSKGYQNADLRDKPFVPIYDPTYWGGGFGHLKQDIVEGKFQHDNTTAQMQTPSIDPTIFKTTPQNVSDALNLLNTQSITP